MSRLTSSQIDKWMSSSSDPTRLKGAEADFIPTPVQAKRGLMDDDLGVCSVWSNRTDFTPTPEIVEIGLTKEWDFLRALWAERLDFTPTSEQIEKGLTDEKYVAWIERVENSSKPYPQTLYTDVQLRYTRYRALIMKKVIQKVRVVIGMISSSWNSRNGVDKGFKWNPTIDQIERGLTHEYWKLRCFYTECVVFTNTPEQVERGLTDENWEVRLAWMKRAEDSLTIRQLSRCLEDKSEEIKSTAMNMIKAKSADIMYPSDGTSSINVYESI